MDFTKIRNYLFISLLAAVTILFFSVIKTFAYPIFWAAILAVLFYPLYTRIDRMINHRDLSTVIVLAAIAIIIVLPLAIIGTLLVKQSFSLYGSISSSAQLSASVKQLTDFIRHNPATATLQINDALIVEKISEVGSWLANYTLTTIKNFAQNSVIFAIMFVITFYTLFFFIRDGEKLLKKLMYLSPLGDRNEMRLYNKFTSVASATIKGTLVIGAVQGSIGAVVLAIAGVPGALIWGVLMGFFSLLPGLGSSVIWLPAGIILIGFGHIWQGVMVLVMGILLISTIDNILRPILVGKATSLHPLIILFSTIGGIAMFDISGFIIGPIIAALFLSFWEMYEEYYREELSSN